MEAVGDIDRAGLDSKQHRRRAIVGSSVGTVIEFYDFTLYGLAAALVFARLFFPGAGDLAGLPVADVGDDQPADPMFLLFTTEQPVLVALGIILALTITQGATAGVAAAMFAELLPTAVRWSGVAISREIPAAILGGTGPLVATALVAAAGGVPWLVAGYLVLLSIIGLLGLKFLPETLRRPA